MGTTRTAKKAPAKQQPEHALAHLIPDAAYAETYVSRKVGGIVDLNLLRYGKAVQEDTGIGVNVMLFGPTGPGKTSLVMAYAAADRIPLVTVQCHGAVDPEEFWGGLAIDPLTGKLQGWQDSEITQIIKHGGVLYLDEVNHLPPKVAAVFNGLLDKRRQITIPRKGNEVVKAHPDLQVVCSFNPDYEGTRPLNPAFKNRFRLKIRFDYDEAVERELVFMPVMLELANSLRQSFKAGDIETPVSTNMLIEFEELALDLGLDFSIENFLNAFQEDERNSVREALTLHDERIQRELREMEQQAQ